MFDLNNSIRLDGYATADINTTEVGQSKTKKCRFRVATSSSRKNADGKWEDFTEYHTVEAWGPSATYAQKQLNKGARVKVEGKLEYGQGSKTITKDGVEFKHPTYFATIRANQLDIRPKKTSKSSEEE